VSTHHATAPSSRWGDVAVGARDVYPLPMCFDRPGDAFGQSRSDGTQARPPGERRAAWLPVVRARRDVAVGPDHEHAAAVAGVVAGRDGAVGVEDHLVERRCGGVGVGDQYMPLDGADGDGFGRLASIGDVERRLAGRGCERVVKVDSGDFGRGVRRLRTAVRTVRRFDQRAVAVGDSGFLGLFG